MVLMGKKFWASMIDWIKKIVIISEVHLFPTLDLAEVSWLRNQVVNYSGFSNRNFISPKKGTINFIW